MPINKVYDIKSHLIRLLINLVRMTANMNELLRSIDNVPGDETISSSIAWARRTWATFNEDMNQIFKLGETAISAYAGCDPIKLY